MKIIHNVYPSLKWTTSIHPVFLCTKEATNDIMNELGLEIEPDYSDAMRYTLHDTDDREILFCRGI